VFPDFAIYHRRDPSRRVLLEIVGFWTPTYLRDKLQRLRAAGAPSMILCIDGAFNCTDEPLAGLGPVIRYKRRIDVEQVIAAVEEMLS